MSAQQHIHHIRRKMPAQRQLPIQLLRGQVAVLTAFSRRRIRAIRPSPCLCRMSWERQSYRLLVRLPTTMGRNVGDDCQVERKQCRPLPQKWKAALHGMGLSAQVLLMPSQRAAPLLWADALSTGLRAAIAQRRSMPLTPLNVAAYPRRTSCSRALGRARGAQEATMRLARCRERWPKAACSPVWPPAPR
jgi:hypothetical protein